MEERQADKLVQNAQAAAGYARAVREHHRKRTDRNSGQRQEDIALALDRLRESMTPLRSEIGRFAFSSITYEHQDLIRGASKALQAERRRLWKMKAKEN